MEVRMSEPGSLPACYLAAVPGCVPVHYVPAGSRRPDTVSFPAASRTAQLQAHLPGGLGCIRQDHSVRGAPELRPHLQLGRRLHTHPRGCTAGKPGSPLRYLTDERPNRVQMCLQWEGGSLDV